MTPWKPLTEPPHLTLAKTMISVRLRIPTFGNYANLFGTNWKGRFVGAGVPGSPQSKTNAKRKTNPTQNQIPYKGRRERRPLQNIAQYPPFFRRIRANSGPAGQNRHTKEELPLNEVIPPKPSWPVKRGYILRHIKLDAFARIHHAREDRRYFVMLEAPPAAGAVEQAHKLLQYCIVPSAPE